MKLNWTSKSAIVLLAVLAGFLGQQKFRQYRLQKTIEAEKLGLQNQLAELQGKNQELSGTLSFLNSPGYKEIVARQQLNLQKEGEQVYSFFEEQETKAEEIVNPRPQGSNFQKWVSYFLNNHGKN